MKLKPFLKYFTITLCCFSLILAGLWWLLPRQQINSTQVKTFDDWVVALMDEAAIPGLAIAKVEHGKVSFIGTYGYANLEKKKKVTRDTLFSIASVSKPIMGLALMQLVDQGKLDLDRDINDYLSFKIDNPKVDGEKITLRHLATHSSGIDDYWVRSDLAENKDSDIPLKQHLKNLLTPEGKEYKNGQYYLPYAPGTNHAYSNLGAALAGVLVEEVMDEDLDRYSQKTIFNALELKHTSWHLANLNPDDIAVPYDVFQCIPYTEFCADTENVERNEIISRIFSPPRKFKRFAPYPNLTSPTWPDGGIRTSINDLSRLLEGILNNKDANNQPLLTDASYKEMFTLQFKDVSQGQRIFWRDNSKGLIGHMGDELGVLAAMYFDLHTNNGMIIMMNREMDSVTVDATKKIGYRLLDSDFSSKN